MSVIREMVEYANVLYDREYVLYYIQVNLLEALEYLPLEQIIELVKEASTGTKVA